MSFSTLILTLNEAQNLSRLVQCLSEVSDDIVVLDSCSTDGTQQVARSLGCRVYERAFDNEAAQRAFGNDLPFRHDWVFNPDADEIPDGLLLKEMVDVASDRGPIVAYEVRFRNFLDGRWIRRSTDYPVWVIRFFRPKCVSFEREINLRYLIDGETGRLEGHFDHFPFSKGLDWWISKHNRYSHMEAVEALKVMGSGSFVSALRRIIKSDGAKNRRIAVKECSFYLPFRGLLRFGYSYIFRLGFLDGRPGLKYSVLISFYEFMIAAKVAEMAGSQKSGEISK